MRPAWWSLTEEESEAARSGGVRSARLKGNRLGAQCGVRQWSEGCRCGIGKRQRVWLMSSADWSRGAIGLESDGREGVAAMWEVARSRSGGREVSTAKRKRKKWGRRRRWIGANRGCRREEEGFRFGLRETGGSKKINSSLSSRFNVSRSIEASVLFAGSDCFVSAECPRINGIDGISSTGIFRKGEKPKSSISKLQKTEDSRGTEKCRYFVY
ncbi:hypothetical protein M5K25_001972 [Dendrobium thyrsiflorum]|uniref:Uncharacterized protein n=1 Tax=Dendrobium thyrsiflorum TaxID=117978 RepID=A0ABD0VRV6_DENTH